MEKSVTKLTGEILEGPLFLDFSWLEVLISENQKKIMEHTGKYVIAIAP